jgi:putative peptide zinc metalloprotease protein
MTLVNGPSAGSDGAPAGATPPLEATDVPARADGVQLIGEMKGSGYREVPALARRGDGQTIQLTPLLYLVLAAVDGTRTCGEVASAVSGRFGRAVSAANVRTLIEDHLRPAGLVVQADGSQPQVQRSNPLLALRFKYAVTDPERTRRVTAPFGWLFSPVVVALVLAALAVVTWWVFFRKGLASAAHEAFDKPGLLLLVVVVTVLSAGFHEFGHAAAARRAGATPGAMGAGIFLVWPAFYTDVTDSYRLGRWGRVVTDLGGLYFNAIVAVAITGVWWATQYDALLLVVATQLLQMVRQLTPLVRFDGYHVLADVTGVPDLFQRIRPTLLGVLPWRWRHPESTVLKPWARAVVTAWVLLVVPLLAFSMFCMVTTLPRIVGTAWASAGKQSTLLVSAWSDADVLEVLARGLAVIAVLFPILAIALILLRMLRRTGTRVWAATRGRPVRRCLAGLLALTLVAALGFVWWPREGTYRPIQPYEGGTLTQVASAARPPTAGLRPGDHGRLTTSWADGDARPTKEKPQLALVLVPRTGSGAEPGSASGSTDTGAGTGSAGTTPEAWVFPFNKPLEPGKGDNQALAVNTDDDTIRYDVAFALVWVEDDSPALNRNEAYAFASCTNCAAVSIGFQVVLVTGDNHVAVPQNISAAVNYDCVNCLTYALATQLFVTLDGPLGEASTQQLAQLWSEIAEFGRNIATVPLSEIQDRLTAYETRILDIIGSGAQQAGRDAPVEAGDPGNEATPSQGPSPAAEPGTAPADEPTGDETTPEPGDATPTDPGTTTGAETGAGADTGTAEPPTAEPTPASEPSANP